MLLVLNFRASIPSFNQQRTTNNQQLLRPQRVAADVDLDAKQRLAGGDVEGFEVGAGECQV